jgi:hypothetical protein
MIFDLICMHHVYRAGCGCDENNVMHYHQTRGSCYVSVLRIHDSLALICTAQTETHRVSSQYACL